MCEVSYCLSNNSWRFARSVGKRANRKSMVNKCKLRRLSNECLIRNCKLKVWISGGSSVRRVGLWMMVRCCSRARVATLSVSARIGILNMVLVDVKRYV